MPFIDGVSVKKKMIAKFKRKKKTRYDFYNEKCSLLLHF